MGLTGQKKYLKKPLASNNNSPKYNNTDYNDPDVHDILPWRGCIVERHSLGFKEFFNLSDLAEYQRFIFECVGNRDEAERLLAKMFQSICKMPYNEFTYMNEGSEYVERYRIVGFVDMDFVL